MAALSHFDTPIYLLNTMEYAAMHYSSILPMNDQVRNLSLHALETEDSLSKVQALIILSILAHSTGEARLSRELLEEAARSSFQIHLDKKEFSNAIQGARRNTVQESARRTWWQLFVLDTLLASLQTGGVLVIKNNHPEVLLPGEDDIFTDMSGGLANDSIQDLKDRFLFGQERTYSSFTYLVEACLILRDTLTQVRSPDRVSPGAHQAVDSRLALWFNSLPAEKREVVRYDGSTDETMFLAHLVAHCAGIYLNLPYSRLTSPMTHVLRLVCRAPGPDTTSPPGTLHTFKLLHAARGITELAGLPVPVLAHTPFFICFVVLSSVVHVGACFALEASIKESHRHHLTLNLSVLDKMASVWVLASLSKDNIRQAAQDVLSVRQSMDSILDVTEI
ncbi:Ff.00g114870.m01.CDS01 [Fusarium sp. VM40]|nr:Ff.00g114870.m01.CDS01 [Fusarium sp. VM40]